MRRCPGCEAESVSARAVFVHLVEAKPFECSECGEVFVLRRRKRWGPFSTGAVYQVLLVGGVMIGIWITALWPALVSVALMMFVEGLAN